MNFLNDDNVDDFHKRFYNFYDSILRGVEHNQESSTLRIIFSVRDSSIDKKEKWINLTLLVSGIKDFYSSPDYNLSQDVLSDGIKVGFKENLFFIDFTSTDINPLSVQEVKESDFYVIGLDCTWEINDYDEYIL